MTWHDVARAACVGIAVALLADGWQSYVVGALMIGAFVLTDWRNDDA